MGACSEEVTRISNERRYDLYLLTDCDIPFTQDGLRDGEHLRQWMTNRFRDELKERQVRWVMIFGSPQQRLRTAVDAIEKLL